MAQMRAAAPSTYHPLLLSGTLQLLPIPLPTPSTSRKADIPEAVTPPQKRLLLTALRPGCEVGESSAAAAARQLGPTMTHRVDCNSVDNVETRVRDTERRMMAALEVVNLRLSYQVDVRRERDLLTSKRVWRPVRPWLGSELQQELEARLQLETQHDRHECSNQDVGLIARRGAISCNQDLWRLELSRDEHP
ncbi:hypothetical protein Tco_0317684 [Tanacetum coccineum]